MAAGHFKLHSSTAETLVKGRRSFKTTEVRGDWQTQAKALADLMNRFLYTAQAEHSLPMQHLHVAWEDYTRRPQASTTNLTSVWVMAGAIAYLGRDEVDQCWQQPSDAKNYADNARLRRWGIYVVGSDHERDAARHLAMRVSRLISSN